MTDLLSVQLNDCERSSFPGYKTEMMASQARASVQPRRVKF